MDRSPSPEATDSSQISGTVLIADDDTALIEALKVRCRRLGLDVLAVSDALTALSSADIAMPNLVILDIEMPGGNGLAACEMLADDQNMADIPVIILTGRKDEETVRRCQSLAPTTSTNPRMPGRNSSR